MTKEIVSRLMGMKKKLKKMHLRAEKVCYVLFFFVSLHFVIILSLLERIEFSNKYIHLNNITS